MMARTLSLCIATFNRAMFLEETLEDACCAELVTEQQHGMAFGTLATMNGIGDVVSSIVVGLLWTSFGTSIAFSYSAVLFLIGSAMILRSAPAKGIVGRAD